MTKCSYVIAPIGRDALSPQPGDFILCHRKGFISYVIRSGERIRFHSGDRWSHAAFVENETTLIEALAKGVVRTPLSHYQNILYVLVRTNLGPTDQTQAVSFARSCIGKSYGFLDDFGIALRFLTPGRGLWFGLNGTEICSGLVAQTQVRGWQNYDVNPASISPAELAEAHGVPAKLSDLAGSSKNA